MPVAVFQFVQNTRGKKVNCTIPNDNKCEKVKNKPPRYRNLPSVQLDHWLHFNQPAQFFPHV